MTTDKQSIICKLDSLVSLDEKIEAVKEMRREVTDLYNYLFDLHEKYHQERFELMNSKLKGKK